MKPRKKSFNLALKRAIRRKLVLTVPKSDARIEEDPFLLLGYGMNSYFQVMVQLMIMTALISLVTIPVMGTFASFSTLSSLPGYNYNQFTLGNIGGADVFCAQATFNVDETAFNVECPAGTQIDLTHRVSNGDRKAVLDYGIIPTTEKVNTYCSSSAFTDPDNCSSYIKKQKLEDDLNSKCVGKDHCMLSKLN